MRAACSVCVCVRPCVCACACMGVNWLGHIAQMDKTPAGDCFAFLVVIDSPGPWSLSEIKGCGSS